MDDLQHERRKQLRVMSADLMTLKEVKKKTALSKSGIYNRINSGTFPAPIKVGPRGSRWVRQEVDGWVENLIRKSRRAPLIKTSEQ